MAALQPRRYATRNLALTILAFVALTFAAGLQGCNSSAPKEEWTKSANVTVTAMMSPEEGKNYLNIIYENFGVDTIVKLKYELLTHHGEKWDTAVKIIEPPVLFKPKDRHLVPRAIGEEPTTADEATVGQVWVVKK